MRRHLGQDHQVGYVDVGSEIKGRSAIRIRDIAIASIAFLVVVTAVAIIAIVIVLVFFVYEGDGSKAVVGARVCGGLRTRDRLVTGSGSALRRPGRLHAAGLGRLRVSRSAGLRGRG